MWRYCDALVVEEKGDASKNRQVHINREIDSLTAVNQLIAFVI